MWLYHTKYKIKIFPQEYDFTGEINFMIIYDLFLKNYIKNRL